MTTENPKEDLSEVQRGEAVMLLLRLNEDLEALRAFGENRHRPASLRPLPEWVTELSPIVPGDDPRQELKRWANLFAEELDTVRAARNRVAHALKIDDADLASAVRAAARLILIARLPLTKPSSDGKYRVSDEHLGAALHFATR